MIRILFILTIILINKGAVAQKNDKVKIFSGFTSGFVVMPLSGTLDKGNGNMSIVSNTSITSYPEYRHVDTTSLAFNLFIPLGINIPVYQNKKWSTGFKFSAAVGYQAGIKAADGLSSIGFDFPQFIYYRRFSHKLDYSLLVGWKYSYVPIPYQLFLVGFDINHIGDNGLLRIYFSPLPYKYYRLLSNGTIEPAIKIYEAGIGFIVNFGN